MSAMSDLRECNDDAGRRTEAGCIDAEVAAERCRNHSGPIGADIGDA